MLVVLTILALLPSGNSQVIYNGENSESLLTCVTNIVNKHYEKSLTYVDINGGGNEITKAINLMGTILLISRTSNVKLDVLHLGYLIVANNSTDFAENFHKLNNEATWKPSNKFLVVIKTLDENNLKDIFNELLKLNVINAIVINGTGDLDVYTYNPFENYACGKYYNRIIHFGNCLNATVKNLFPVKLVTGFRRCTIRAVAPHLPPYSIDPSRQKQGEKHLGLEQYAFHILSQLEEFKVNYTYMDFAEQFSDLDDNLKATGSFKLIQSNETDVLLGFTMLSSMRANAFDYLYKHIAFSDEHTTVVKKAGNVPVWKTMYMEFDQTVWTLLALAFICVLLVFLVILRVNDKTVIFFKLWDNLLQHGHIYQCRSSLKTVLIAWIWFTFLVNAFYQSSLMSLTTNPAKSYQVSTIEDLVNLKYKPCISPALGEFLHAIADQNFSNDVNLCKTMVRGMEVVSRVDGLFTIVPLSIYNYNKYLFFDENGNDNIFHFHRPLNKVIYATFLYKGWPMYERFDSITLRVREVGLMKYYSRYVHRQNEGNFKRYRGTRKKARMIVPWNVIGIGAVVSALIFILEILGKRYPEKSKNLV